jgi:class 3 adenylate cyclase
VARLDSAKRGDLPDSAFAYVDSHGRRRLPIHDEAHVRNALARFGQVRFEDEPSMERARRRLLTAAKKYGIVPVGFITGQLQSERELGRRRAVEPMVLPSGFVTLLMTDIEGSTGLVHQLGENYQELLTGVRRLLSDATTASGGLVVETRADELFAVFEQSRAALDMAVAVQRELRARLWHDGLAVRVRIGIHSGKPTVSPPNYVGIAVNTTARVCAAGHGGQILVSSTTRDALRGTPSGGVRFLSLGPYRLRGLPGPVSLFQLGAKGLPSRFPALRL